ncbi:MAG: hypothetical protein ACXABY_19415, partial [Candidatus Thorarchaeota archaeon]
MIGDREYRVIWTMIAGLLCLSVICTPVGSPTIQCVQDIQRGEPEMRQVESLGQVYHEDTTGNAFDVYVSGDYAYVADSASGLAVIDISDPTNPGTPVYEDTSGTASGVFVSGDYAYVATGT